MSTLAAFWRGADIGNGPYVQPWRSRCLLTSSDVPPRRPDELRMIPRETDGRSNRMIPASGRMIIGCSPSSSLFSVILPLLLPCLQSGAADGLMGSMHPWLGLVVHWIWGAPLIPPPPSQPAGNSVGVSAPRTTAQL